MVLNEALGKDARIWVKSEWGPASEDWPAVSFSKRSVGDYLRKEFVPGRDAILYIGTSNPATTGNPAHRQRLLSAVNIEPKQLLETRDCIVSATRTPSCSARFSVASCLHGHNETAAKSRLARVGQ